MEVEPKRRLYQDTNKKRQKPYQKKVTLIIGALPNEQHIKKNMKKMK